MMFIMPPFLSYNVAHHQERWKAGARMRYNIVNREDVSLLEERARISFHVVHFRIPGPCYIELLQELIRLYSKTLRYPVNFQVGQIYWDANFAASGTPVA